jgi:monovalent cation:H+ antiporter-2, CPA2 family
VEEGRLVELLVALGVAAAGVAVFARLGLPTIAGFLAMGALVGPGALGLADPAQVRDLAQLGVVFLLFEIGLELPFDRVRDAWREAVSAGALQVVLTVAIVAGGAAALGVATPVALVLGALVAMSSTALVIGLLAERAEADAPHGRIAVGVCLFQDLCIVPFLIALPVLAGRAGSTPGDVALSVAKLAAGLAVLAVAARVLVPRLLDAVASLRSRDLFGVVALLLVVGSAVVAEELGLTLAVGAFLGGIVASSSPYAHQLFAEVVPLRGALLALFFTAVGMLLDPRAALEAWPAVLGYVVAVVAVKTLVVALVVATLLRRGAAIGLRAGLTLAQTGEFSFVLATEAGALGLLPEALSQVFVAGSVITLLATPFLVRAAPWLSSRLASAGEGSEPGAAAREAFADMDGHALLVGFGMTGRNVARALKAAGIPCVAVDTNPHTVREAAARGERIVFGDATREPLLRRLGLPRARQVVVALSDPAATREVVALARRLAPEARILARTHFVANVDALAAAGANVVVAEEFEATIDLIGEALRGARVDDEAIDQFSGALREEGYDALRAPPGLALDPWLAELLAGPRDG